MKITMYELYGKIYDENPPKHIKVYGEDWYWNDYDGYVTKESLKTTPDTQIYLMDRYRTFMDLDQEVEIIEEPKKIEKLEPVRGSDLSDLTDKDMVLKNNALIELCKTLNNMNNKINELIDTVNGLKRDK